MHRLALSRRAEGGYELHEAIFERAQHFAEGRRLMLQDEFFVSVCPWKGVKSLSCGCSRRTMRMPFFSQTVL